ncbi:hypothetical protein [Flavobacterium sp.]|uniref:hypothetical protein n=1 Tax=Flavobacterium sp. TaxID=239 RepID=UPI00260AB30E|nr:hypothetical protein [Flavobacterium sp.]
MRIEKGEGISPIVELQGILGRHQNDIIRQMILLDILVGQFLPSLFGWTFLVFVLITESFLLSKYLTKSWRHKTIFTTVIVSNVITTIIGYLLLDEESGGGHLLNWIPVDHYHGDIRLDRTLFLFISTFIGSVIVEGLFNILVIKRYFAVKKIILGTVLVNMFTYLAGGLTILIYNIYTL